MAARSTNNLRVDGSGPGLVEPATQREASHQLSVFQAKRSMKYGHIERKDQATASIEI